MKFTKYTGKRPLIETSIDDVPGDEREAYWKERGFCQNDEIEEAMSDEEASQLYDDWFAAQEAMLTAHPYVDTCIEHGPGGTLRLPFQIRVF